MLSAYSADQTAQRSVLSRQSARGTTMAASCTKELACQLVDGSVPAGEVVGTCCCFSQ